MSSAHKFSAPAWADALRRRVVGPTLLALVWMVSLPMTVSADVAITNFLEASVPSSATGPRFFDYQGAQQQLYTTTTDWNSGSFSDTTVAAGGDAIELASAGPPYEVCINSGGPDYTAIDGTFYQADAYFTGGGTITWSRPIRNTDDDTIFQTIRYAFTAGGLPTYTYAIPVPAPGSYTVEVGLLESFNFPPYQNQTDLWIEGVQVLDDYNPYAITGRRFAALIETFTTTTTDATVDLLVGHGGWYGAIANVCVRSIGGGSLATSGTWTSPVIDTLATGTNVFGLLGNSATTPAGTEVRMRFSQGATSLTAAAGPFVGPDGTTGTWYSSNEPIDYAHDFGGQFVAVELELLSSTPGVTPTVDATWLSWDLPEVVSFSTPLTIASNPTGQSGWLIRVRTDDVLLTTGTATIELLSASGGGELTVGTDHPSTQIDIIAGVVIQSSGPPFAVDPANPHSVSIVETAMVGGNVVARWTGVVDGVLITHDFDVSFS